MKRLNELLKWINANWAVLGLGISLLGILIARLLFDVSIFQPFEEIAAKQAEYREKKKLKKHQKLMVDRHLKLGSYFLSNSRYNAAEAEFDKVLKIDKMNPAAQMGLFKTGVYKAFAEKEFIPEVVERQIHFILEEDPNDPHAHVIYGNLYAQLEDFDNARKQYELALKSVDKPASAYFGLGILYEKDNSLDKAIEMYQEAVKHSKWNERYLNNLASVYRKKGEYEEAIKKYEQVLRLDYEYLLPYMEISLVYRLSGDLKRAVVYQKRLVTLLNDSTLTGLQKNKEVWFFEAQGQQVKLYSVDEKKKYLFYSLCGTLYILGRDKDVKSYAKMAEAIQVGKNASIKRLVAQDLKLIAKENRDYSISVEKLVGLLFKNQSN